MDEDARSVVGHVDALLDLIERMLRCAVFRRIALCRLAWLRIVRAVIIDVNDVQHTHETRLNLVILSHCNRLGILGAPERARPARKAELWIWLGFESDGFIVLTGEQPRAGTTHGSAASA